MLGLDGWKVALKSPSTSTATSTISSLEALTITSNHQQIALKTNTNFSCSFIQVKIQSSQKRKNLIIESEHIWSLCSNKSWWSSRKNIISVFVVPFADWAAPLELVKIVLDLTFKNPFWRDNRHFTHIS